MINRRGLITGFAALVAPALVKASSLMQIRGEKLVWRPRGPRLLVESVTERGAFIDIGDTGLKMYRPLSYEFSVGIAMHDSLDHTGFVTVDTTGPRVMRFDDGSQFVASTKDASLGTYWEEIT